MGNLASTYRNQGRWDEAETLEVQVMETRKTKLGADHPSTLTSMANLASTYRNQGRWDEAETLEVQVMETRKDQAWGGPSFYADQHGQPSVDVLEPGPVGRGRDARGAGDGDSQDQARGGPSFHADQHGQPGVDVPEPGPVGRRPRRWLCR